MTNEERDLIRDFISRVGGASAGGGFASSVPATQPALPPVDREADAFIAELFARYPEARYRITQMAFVQEHALAEAQNQINRLQWELQNQRSQQQAPAPGNSPWGAAAQPQQSRGFFGGLFGGRAQQAPQPQYQQHPYQQQQYQQQQYAPPPPQYAPGYQPGMFQQRGSGFLGSALTTAAGVAGGMVAGHALMNLFSGGHGGGFGSMASAPAMPMLGETPASPWAAPGGDAAPSNDPYETGGATKDAWDNSAGGGWQQADQGGWQQAASDQGGWQDASQDQGWQDASGQDAGGWDDAGGSDPDNT
jgi:hypothetical protein